MFLRYYYVNLISTVHRCAIEMIAGIPGDLYYVKDGIINDYALTFNIPIKSNVDEIFFNWQSFRSNPPVT